MFGRRSLPKIVMLAVLANAFSAAGRAGEIQIDYSRDIQPILAQHCLECHGMDTQEGGFRFDRRASSTAPGHLRFGRTGWVMPDTQPTRLADLGTATALVGADVGAGHVHASVSWWYERKKDPPAIARRAGLWGLYLLFFFGLTN